MSSINSKTGYFKIKETFESNGTVNIEVVDTRTNKFICIEVDNLEDHTYVMTYLSENQSISSPVFLQEKFAS